MSTQEHPVYRYGDFPELFWDLKPDAEIDRSNLRMIARVLTDGSMDAVRKLVPMDVLLRDFEKLDMPDNARRFWSLVVERRRKRLTSAERGRKHAS
jgi:hypothetical protein